jgi:hypothetical protein
LKVLAEGSNNINNVRGKECREAIGYIEADFSVEVQMDGLAIILDFVDCNNL